jgi:phosphatidylserine/phosphatidylglycerophosphate/cardiolipin synthase-like enzyme
MSFSVYQIKEALPLRNEQYFEFLNGKFQEARKRIWASIFIINPIVEDDVYLAVRTLLKKLAYAKWRNVDIRILVGTSNNPGIRVANDTAYEYLRNLDIPVRKFIGKYRKSLHSKYVIIDDEIIVVGSHNWTPGAAGKHNEDSIAVCSQELNRLLCDEFISNWQYSEIIVSDENDE